MTKTKAFFPHEEQQWEVIDAKVKRQIVGYDTIMMMVNVHFETGGIGPIHKHIHTQVSYVAKGIFEVTIGKDMKVMRKGDSFFVASHIEHGVKCLEEGILVDVFSPMRADFIK